MPFRFGCTSAQHGLSGDDGVEGVAAGAQHVLGGERGLRRHGRGGVSRAARQLLHGLIRPRLVFALAGIGCPAAGTLGMRGYHDACDGRGRANSAKNGCCDT